MRWVLVVWHKSVRTHPGAFVVFASAVLLLRFPFRSEVLYSWDCVQFALGSLDYNVPLYQPHPPGYVFYVGAGKLLNLFTQDPNLSFIVISIAASFLTLCVVYFFGSALFGQPSGLFAALALLFSPVFWFYGEIGVPYTLEAFFHALLGFVFWKMKQQGRYALLAGSLLGLSGGIRQNLPIFLFPLYVYSLIPVARQSWRQAALSFFAFFVTCCTWYIPMAYFSGGFLSYQKALSGQWNYVLSFSVFKSGLSAGSERFLQVLYSIFFGGFGVFTVYLMIIALACCLFRKKIPCTQKSSADTLFFVFWIAPSFLFYVLVFFEYPPYALSFYPALFILFSGVCKFASTRFLPGKTFHLALSCAGAFGNTLIFFLFFYAAMTRNNSLWREKETLIRTRFSPQDAILLASLKRGRSEKNFFRHAMYYLPEYKTCFLPAIATKEKHKTESCALGQKSQSIIPGTKRSHKVFTAESQNVILLDDYLVSYYRGSPSLKHLQSGSVKLYYFPYFAEKIMYKFHEFHFQNGRRK